MSSSTALPTQSGERLTFHQLFAEKGYNIQIPIIQRDYAQGRPSTAEIRNLFLHSIKTYLDKNEKNNDLDFVYGSLLDENGISTQKFIPLDGQQRLTTLFLLHWYLATKDKRINEFKAILVENNKSKFTYETRTSSTDFCNALLNNTIDLDKLLEKDKGANNQLSKTIKDSNWYYLSWANDPTIKSMLVMLDAIHQQFYATTNYYERLTDKQNPIITFQFLNLKEFKLTDDLYIKMNARGKPLTTFENFKAKFEQLIAHEFGSDTSRFSISHSGTEKQPVTVKDYFSNKIDTDWANLFWKYRNTETNIFDEQLMNLFRALAITHLANKSDINESVQNLTILLRKNESITFHEFELYNCFDKDYIIELIELLDLLQNGENTVKHYLTNANYYNEADTFNHIIITNTYADAYYTARIQFYGYCQYLIKWKQEEGLEAWMRVIHNLSENTAPYDRETAFINAIKSIKELLPFSKDILTHLKNDGKGSERGFSSRQVEEEKLKAVLISKSEVWADLIITTEQELKYFKGQLTYLLSFSGIFDYFSTDRTCNWDEETNKTFYDSFVDYINKSKLFFEDSGLKPFENHLFERALLSKGIYLLPESANWSFLINSDRDISWKRLLLADREGDKGKEKASFVKHLMDDNVFKNNNNAIEGLNYIINASKDNILDWTKYFIALPQLLASLGNKKFIRIKTANEIYLLAKEKMNGKHYEYYTYSMYWKYFENKDFSPFISVGYDDVNFEAGEPCVVLKNWEYSSTSFEIKIKHSTSSEYYLIEFSDKTKGEIVAGIEQILTKHNFILNNFYKRYELKGGVSEEDLMKTINNLLADLKSI